MQHLASPKDTELCAPAARRFVLISAILASSLGFIDGSMVSIALPAMRETLGGTLVQAQWVSNAYMLTLASLILAGGAAGDRFGLARVFSIGIGIFVVASLGCALAQTPQIMIAARGIQGIGAALMVPGSLALISRAYQGAERSRAIGIWAACAAVTSGLGPIIGGLALTLGGSETWRWIFAINLPLGALALYLLWRNLVQDPAQPDRKVDWIGAVLATAGLGLIALSLSETAPGTFLSAHSTTIAIIGGVSIAGFIAFERIVAHPMMPLDLFANAGFSRVNLISFSVYFAFAAISFYLPMTVIAGWGISEIKASAIFAPLSVFIALLSGLSSKLATRFGPARVIAAGAFVLASGYALLACCMHMQDFWLGVMPAMCLQGIGMGLFVAPMSNAVMMTVAQDMTGTASGINNAVTRMAGLIAVAAMGSVVVAGYVTISADGSFGAMDSDDPLHRAASTIAFARVAWIACGLALAGAVLALIAPLDGSRAPEA